MQESTLKIWLKETRADFLVLSVLLCAVGGAAASGKPEWSWPLFLLTTIGIVLTHMSVNLFNEYSDWRTGIDDATERTPFSGGSGMMQAGLTKPEHVRLAAWTTLLASGIMGLVLAWQSGPLVLVFMAVGGITIVGYTEYLTRWGIGELASGISLGSLVVLGTYYVQTGNLGDTAIWASISPGLLTMQLLFLNEFPDAEADRAGGRRHLVILLGKQRSAVVYAVLMVVVYAVIIAGVFVRALPVTALIALATIPLAVMASLRAIRFPEDLPKLTPGLALNVVTVLATDALLAVGLFIG
jgi:1,4-dihydroxy-2-naphthoate polyprenyltransferase